MNEYENEDAKSNDEEGCHKKTSIVSMMYKDDLNKVKNILEEDIVNTIFKQCEP